MRLLIFDIDGTIIDSVKHDGECFIQSVEETCNIELSGTDWNDFIHVTDTGITIEIYQKHFGRDPTENEINFIKNRFYQLISQRKHEMKEIEGASSALLSLMNSTEISIAFATGGWKETAELKLNHIGIKPEEHILKTSNDHFDRAVITKMAIDASLKKEDLQLFDSITYIGDGLWDYKTSQALGIGFIGIDYHRNNQLAKAGASPIINKLNKLKEFMY